MEGPAFTGGAAKDGTADIAGRGNSSFQQDTTKPQSEIIGALLGRRTMLPPGGALDAVATAALNASARVAEADLRSARLRAEAKSKNWLPTIGPRISLTSLGDLVAGILVEQILFDNGHRKAERAFAAADVEVAAVTLSQDMNGRVQTALALYVSALRADEKAALNARGLQRMHGFERIVIGRVEGGVSDQSDRRVVEAKLNDLSAARSAATEAAATARAELQAMTGASIATPGNDMALGVLPDQVVALAVLKAEAEAGRSVAQAGIDRAGLLPGLTASANVTGSGTAGALNAGAAQGFGFGTGAALRALEVSKDAAARHVNEAREIARRSESRLVQRLASFRRQEAEAAKLAASGRETFVLFERQFEVGQRSVMDVISIYEKLVQREQAHIDAKYEVTLIQLELARDRGVLADGGSI